MMNRKELSAAGSGCAPLLSMVCELFPAQGKDNVTLKPEQMSHKLLLLGAPSLQTHPLSLLVRDTLILSDTSHYQG